MKPVVLLLIAGKSKRFWPLKEKSLWRIAGKTVLEYQVERIKTAGCKDILLVGGAHNKKDAKKLFPSFPFIEQKSYEHGMQDAMLAALPKCKGRPIIVIGGNDVVDVNAYKKLLAIASKKNIDGAILAKEVHEYFPGGYIKMKGSRIGAIVEKPGKGKEPSNFINIVAHYHRNPEALLATLKKTTSKSDDGYERALTSLFTTHTYVPVRYDGVWYPIKFPWHLLALLPP
jgi:NDP-sugar pyrophosphorylase family protein